MNRLTLFLVLRQKHGASTAENMDEAHVRMALDKLRIMDVIKGKSGIGGKNRKEMGEHKFWATQPVPQLGKVPVRFPSVN